MARSLSLDDILSAAETILRASGADALSMRTVAREANLAHSGLYNYVSNRSELLALLAERIWNSHVAEPADSAQSIDTAVVALISVIRRDPPMANLLKSCSRATAPRPVLSAASRKRSTPAPRNSARSTEPYSTPWSPACWIKEQRCTTLPRNKAKEVGTRILRMVAGDDVRVQNEECFTA